MKMSNYRRGANFERYVATTFQQEGFLVARSAGSGSTQRLCPDLMAFDGIRFYVVECKSYSGDNGYQPSSVDEDSLLAMHNIISTPDTLDSPLSERAVLLVVKNSDGGVTKFRRVSESGDTSTEPEKRLYQLFSGDS